MTVVPHNPTTAVEAHEPPAARAEVDTWVRVVADVSRLAEYIAQTSFVPKALRGNPAATAAAILAGRESGLPPMAALRHTHVIEGSPSISAEAQRALVLAAGHELEFVESTGAICTVRGRRRGSQTWQTVTWTLDMAKAAGLAGRDNWRNHPRRMLQARASAELAAMTFPDVVLGFAVAEELEDGTDAAPQEGRTTVQRKGSRAAASRPTSPVPEAPPVIEGPPLPGAGSGATPATDPAPSQGSSPDQSPPSGEDPAPAADEEAKADQSPRPATAAQKRMMFAQLNELDVKADEDQHRVVSALVRRPVGSFTTLTKHEASQVVDTLARIVNRHELDALVGGFEQPALEVDEGDQ